MGTLILALLMWQQAQPCSGHGSTEHNTPNCEVTVTHETLVGTGTTFPQATCDATFCYQPIDVPAVEEPREEEYGDSNWCNHCDNFSCTAMACDPHAKHKFNVTTCKDKSRILEHDENTPPKYWCRKVQP